MVGRARLQTVAQDADGNVQGALSIQILKEDGSAFDGTLYNAQTGGSVVTSPRTTNSTTGLLEVWTDANSAKRVILRATGATDLKASFDYDPQDVFIQSMNRAAVLDGYAGVSDYVLRAQPTTGGSTGNKIAIFKDASSNTVLEVGKLGGGGTYNDLVATYHNSGVGPFVISNVRNWNTNSDFTLAITKLTGTVTGSHPITELTYQTCAQPTDGFNGVTNIPDQNVINVVYFANNIASGASQNHDGSGRGGDFQTVVYENTGQRTMAGLLVGVHTAMIKTSYTDQWLATGSNVGYTAENGDCGIIIRNDVQGYAGFGTNRQGNTALLTSGALGWKQHIACRNTSDVTIFAVDSAGVCWANGLYPVPGSSVTIGTSARVFTSAFISTFSAGNGSAANPSLSVLGTGNYADGLFGVAGGSVVGVGIAGTEKGRWDATGIQYSSGERYSGAALISPSQITADQNDYNPTGLSTARLLRLSSDAARNITGITAPSGGKSQLLCLQNFGSFTITLKHQSASSAAANRINGPSAADISLPSLASIQLVYDVATTGWFKFGT